MGRHKKSIERPLMPDVKYNSKVVSKLVCRMMLDGKKATCQKIVYEAMDNLKAKTEKDPLEVMLKAMTLLIEPNKESSNGGLFSDKRKNIRCPKILCS